MRLLHIFWDSDMRCTHPGLWKIAKKNGVTQENLGPGEMVVFVNTKKDRIKVLAGLNEDNSRGMMAYYRSPRGRITVEALQFIPDAFQGGEIRYPQMLRKALLKNLGKHSEDNTTAKVHAEAAHA